ncbi:hypothetical protein BP6252_12525 [Coleophoma cylindrospora]|uniref:Uncharacterized protein n=1 Tax=Coleophoma cylindrospora TaxID=1849047 RepID=A0A3D8QCV7_9HELO|nr:hypothetical protein BP6252_12525 [Coleophoma cylindrospora]
MLTHTTVASYGNSSIATASRAVSPYKYCGCELSAEVIGMLWWDIIYPIDGPTIVYTVIEGTNSTIGSHIVQPSTTATLPESISVSLEPYLAEGNLEVHTVNASSITLTQEIIYDYLTMYSVDTWTTFSTKGALTSQCISAATESISLPFAYTYTTVTSLPWNHTAPNNQFDSASEDDPVALVALESYIASIIGAQNCSAYVLGIAGLKVGVSLLTTSSTVYQTPVAITTPSAQASTLSTLLTTAGSASPAKSPTTTQPTPTSTSIPSRPTSIFSSAEADQPSTSTLPTSTSGNNGQGGSQGVSSSQGTGVGGASSGNAASSPSENGNGGQQTSNSQGSAVGGSSQSPSPSPTGGSGGIISSSAGGSGSDSSGGFGASNSQSQPVTVVQQIGSSSYTIIVLPSSGYAIGGNTLSAGGSAATIGGATVTADSSGLAIYTTPAGTEAPSPILKSYIISTTETPAIAIVSGQSIVVPTSPAIVVGSQMYTPSVLSAGGIVVAGQTLTTGGNMVVDGMTISLASGGSAVVVGDSTTQALTASQTLSVSTLPGGGLVVAGQTLTSGGNVVVGGQTLSLVSGGSGVVIGGSSTKLLVIPTTPVVVVGSQTFTASILSSGGIVVGGQTLSTDGSVVLGGQTVSLAPGGSSVVVGGSTTEGLVGATTSTSSSTTSTSSSTTSTSSSISSTSSSTSTNSPTTTSTSPPASTTSHKGGAMKTGGSIGWELFCFMIFTCIVMF